MQTLRTQFDEYASGRARRCCRVHARRNQLPAELYADNLKRFGVQMDPRELMARALASYQQTRSEMEPLARRIAEEHKWSKTDYRDVIRELKKQRIADDQLLRSTRRGWSRSKRSSGARTS